MTDTLNEETKEVRDALVARWTLLQAEIKEECGKDKEKLMATELLGLRNLILQMLPPNFDLTAERKRRKSLVRE